MKKKKTPRLFNRLGMLAIMKNDFPAAISEFRKALMIDPTNIIAIQKLANLYTLLQQHADALRYFEQSVSLAGDDLEMRSGLAACYEINEKFLESQKSYELIAKAKPDFEYIEFHLARVLSKQKLWNDAAGYIVKAKERYPEDSDVVELEQEIQKNLESPVKEEKTTEKPQKKTRKKAAASDE